MGGGDDIESHLKFGRPYQYLSVDGLQGIEYEEVEKLFRFFIKKMLYLYKTTPNYVLYLETGLDSLYLSTLNLHFNYIIKTLNINSSRLPNILAKYILNNKLFWVGKWETLLCELQISNVNFSNPIEYCDVILEKLKFKQKDDYVRKSQSLQNHDLYYKLNYSVI